MATITDYQLVQLERNRYQVVVNFDDATDFVVRKHQFGDQLLYEYAAAFRAAGSIAVDCNMDPSKGYWSTSLAQIEFANYWAIAENHPVGLKNRNYRLLIPAPKLIFDDLIHEDRKRLSVPPLIDPP